VKRIVNFPGEVARVYALPENSRGRKQEKMMNIAFVNRVRIPFIFKMVPLEFTLYPWS
jgi:hypothetical protein